VRDALNSPQLTVPDGDWTENWHA